MNPDKIWSKSYFFNNSNLSIIYSSNFYHSSWRPMSNYPKELMIKQKSYKLELTLLGSDRAIMQTSSISSASFKS